MNLDLRVDELEMRVKELEEQLRILLERETKSQAQKVLTTQPTSDQKPQSMQQHLRHEVTIPVPQPCLQEIGSI